MSEPIPSPGWMLNKRPFSDETLKLLTEEIQGKACVIIWSDSSLPCEEALQGIQCSAPHRLGMLAHNITPEAQYDLLLDACERIARKLENENGTDNNAGVH